MGNIAHLFHCLKLRAFNCQLLALKEAPILHRGEGPQSRDLDLSRDDQAPTQAGGHLGLRHQGWRLQAPHGAYGPCWKDR